MISIGLNARLRADHREELFEAPLRTWLQNSGSVIGGETELTRDGEVRACFIFLDVEDVSATWLKELAEELILRGAPRGSYIQVEDQVPVFIGRERGVAIYLDGVGLPTKVYEENDVNDLIEVLNLRLSGIARLRSWREGHTSTALYFYGDDREDWITTIKTELTLHALGQGALIELLN